MTVSLPQAKIDDLTDELNKMIASKKVTKRQLQSICGKLNYATQCIYGGRFHLRRLLDIICTLRKPWHRTRVTRDMLADCQWWLSYMRSFNGTVHMVDPRPVTPVFIDACREAAGACYGNDYTHVTWNNFLPSASNIHINFKEVLALEPACLRWAPQWVNRKVIVHSDNQAALSQINKLDDRLSNLLLCNLYVGYFGYQQFLTLGYIECIYLVVTMLWRMLPAACMNLVALTAYLTQCSSTTHPLMSLNYRPHVSELRAKLEEALDRTVNNFQQQSYAQGIRSTY